MARGCIFCGKSPTTREHLVPKWVSAVLKQDHRGLDPRGGVEAEVLLRQTLIHRATWSNPNAIDFVANCVCASCNGGWMSVIENEAKLVLTPLIKGTWKTLDVPAQRTIANWLALKATIDLYASKVPVSIPRKFRRHLYESHTPPPTWQFCIGIYLGSKPIVITTEVIEATSSMGSLSVFSTKKRRSLTTIAIGYFVAQVLTTELAGPQFRDDLDRFIRIPPEPGLGEQDRPVQWPPPLEINDHMLQSIITTGIPRRR